MLKWFPTYTCAATTTLAELRISQIWHTNTTYTNMYYVIVQISLYKVILISTTKNLIKSCFSSLSCTLIHLNKHISCSIYMQRCVRTCLQTHTCRKPFFQSSLILHVLIQLLRQPARLHLQTFRVWKFFTPPEFTGFYSMTILAWNTAEWHCCMKLASPV